MDRRLILAIVLMMLIAVAPSFLFKKQPKPPVTAGPEGPTAPHPSAADTVVGAYAPSPSAPSPQQPS